MSVGKSTKAPRTLYLGVLTALFAFLSLASWAYSSPVGSSPDDNFHLASIWCGQGEDPIYCREQTGSVEPLVPAGTFDAALCFAFNSDADASCQTGAMNSVEYISASASNVDGLYPPVFYGAMKVLVNGDVQNSVLAMRLFNALVAVIMLGILAFLLPPRLKLVPVAATLLTAVPLGMFIIPSTNPSSWAVICASTLLFSMIGAFTTQGWRRIALGALALVSITIGAGSRADAGIYAATAVAAALVITSVRRKGLIGRLLFSAVIGAIAGIYVLSASQFSKASEGLAGATASGMSPVELTLHNILWAPYLWSGVFGTWGLGWLDTPMPLIVPALSLGSLLLIVVTGLRYLSLRHWVAIAFPACALLALPTIVLVQSDAVIGVLVQPRYIYPLVLIITGLLLFGYVSKAKRPASWQVASSLLMLTVANAVALHQDMERYVVGLNNKVWNLDEVASWWWIGIPGPTTIWLIGVISFTSMACLIFLLSLKTSHTSWGMGARALSEVSAPSGAQ